MPKDQIDPNKQWFEQAFASAAVARPGQMEPPFLHRLQQMMNDPKFKEWRWQLSVVLARWLQQPDGKMYLTCPPEVTEGR